VVLVFFLFFSLAFSKCNSHPGSSYEKFLSQALEKVNSLSYSRQINSVLRVPIVFHVLWSNDVEGTKLSENTLKQEIAYLNQWLTATNRYYQTTSQKWKDHAADENDLQIQFELAAFDPEGNPTDGILYIESDFAACSDDFPPLNDESQGGSALWDTTSYINIYTCDIAGNTLGYSSFPGDNPDRLVMDIGIIGSDNDYGATIFHELGHYFGLLHTFNSEEVSCSYSDNISDTPDSDKSAQTYVSTGAECPGRGNADDSDFVRCDKEIMVQNVMDYNEYFCVTFMSKDQAKFFRNTLETTRKSLYSSKGLSQGNNPNSPNSPNSPVSPNSPNSPVSPNSPSSLDYGSSDGGNSSSGSRIFFSVGLLIFMAI